MTSATTAAGGAGLTWEEFLALPDDDALRHAELIDGEVVVAPPTDSHQLVVMNLVEALRGWRRAGPGRGETTMDPAIPVAPSRGYLPDLAWYPTERCAPPDAPPSFSNPPALVVEVLSPSTRRLDEQRKSRDFARLGVDEMWLVDPAEPAVLVLRRAPEASSFEVAADLGVDDELTSPLLPGFALRVGDLLRR